jgi:hypothetical protein
MALSGFCEAGGPIIQFISNTFFLRFVANINIAWATQVTKALLLDASGEGEQ